jgi:hypothetical protein
LGNKNETEQEIIVGTESEEEIPYDSDSGHDKDSATVDCNNNADGSQVHIWLRPHHTWNVGGAGPFTGGPCGLRIQEVTHVNMDSTPIIIFFLFLMEVIQLLIQKLIDTTINISTHLTMTIDAHGFQT